ncbi:polypeptide N-acetylgalactosaminyltransferase 1, partial [Culex quinquefasciatus]|uniref:polypeptide N-acetylgalactosaminyltransferase 1 n=1 Tax=Culex quinquefasciatus TaxID=7176 RepID=UPI0018E39710
YASGNKKVNNAGQTSSGLGRCWHNNVFPRGLSIRRNLYSKLILVAILALFVLFYFKNLNGNGQSPNSIPIANGLVGALNRGNILVAVAGTGGQDALLEQLVLADLAKQERGLGDNGKGVELTGEAREIGEKQLATIALNEELSEHLSYNRTPPDERHPSCKRKSYDIENLPSTSVIIIFYNEPYSVLVRTVHSVLNTADERLLKEIVLVDDGSTNEELKGKLDYYVRTRLLSKVKVLRQRNRLVWVCR